MNVYLKKLLKIKLFIVITIIFLGIGKVQAAKQKYNLLAKIDTDDTTTKTHFLAKTIEMSYNSSYILNFLAYDFNPKGKLIKTTIMPLDNIAKEGVVLVKRGKRNIIVIKSNNFSRYYGGNMTLVYLKNGILGSRGELELQLSRCNQSWCIYKDGKPVRRMFIKANKTILGTLGIEKITCYSN